eukprot:GHRR01026685.1.p1 GENE.GHRR01026685.1~~GHRR01026685.1.p1  ORF type:complete len:431 (+),score=190.32 GHRR01026685.1:315-1607(+)
MHNKKLYLNIEEALFMMDQAEVLLLLEHEPGQHQLLSMQEAMHMMLMLGIHQERLQVYSHLSRQGYTIRRHPAFWLCPAGQCPSSIWQSMPAWSHTDGLLQANPLQQQALQPSPQLFSPDPDASAGGKQQLQHRQQQMQQGRQPRDPLHPATVVKLLQQQTADNGTGSPRKRQKMDSAMDARQDGWWPQQPKWLQGIHLAASSVSATSSSPEQLDQAGPHSALPMLLGLELQQQFPALRPLPTYRGHGCNGSKRTSISVQDNQQQDLQQLAAVLSSSRAYLVFDTLLREPHFSYKQPPGPQLSIAMVKDGCTLLPSLDELLDLSTAAAALAAESPALASAVVATAAAGVRGCSIDGQANSSINNDGKSTRQVRVQCDNTAAQHSSVEEPSPCEESFQECKPVVFGIPDGSDVNFYQLQPVQLINQLTNGR